jgi:hypothetical protein
LRHLEATEDEGAVRWDVGEQLLVGVHARVSAQRGRDLLRRGVGAQRSQSARR